MSGDGAYRYDLWRVWDAGRPLAMWILLNPSTADQIEDDPTIRRVTRFSRDWGLGGFCVVNLFAYRTSRPVHLGEFGHDPVGPRCDEVIAATANHCRYVVAGWGAHRMAREWRDPRNGIRSRAREVFDMLRGEWVCLGYTKGRAPRHPLYVRASQYPVAFGLGG